MSLKEKFENINFDEIPDHYSFELETIKDETNNFTDEDALPIFEREFNYLYNAIMKKYPTALRSYVAPPPTADEIANKLKQKQKAEKEEADRIEADRLKQEKIDKAIELANKYKKKPAGDNSQGKKEEKPAEVSPE